MKTNTLNNEVKTPELTEKKITKRSLRRICVKPNSSLGKSDKLAGLKWRRNPIAKWLKK